MEETSMSKVSDDSLRERISSRVHGRLNFTKFVCSVLLDYFIEWALKHVLRSGALVSLCYPMKKMHPFRFRRIEKLSTYLRIPEKFSLFTIGKIYESFSRSLHIFTSNNTLVYYFFSSTVSGKMRILQKWLEFIYTESYGLQVNI